MAVFLTLAGMFVSILLILVILLQRGRGGGLVGALSGLGGQSAFGTKAGDTFTRITIIIAAVWVMLAGISGQVLRSAADKSANYDKAELKTDLQSPSKDGKKNVPAKDAEADSEEDFVKETTKPTTDADKEKEPAESSGDSPKDTTPKIEKDVKPESPSKKESEPNARDIEKKNEADGDAAKSK